MNVQRRSFLQAVLGVPLVGDVIRINTSGLMDWDGQSVHRVPDSDEVESTIYFYARVRAPYALPTRVQDDVELKRLIHKEAGRAADDLYRFIKKAATDPKHQAHQHRKGQS